MDTEQLVKETYAQWQQCQAVVAQLLPHRHNSKNLQNEAIQLRQELTQQCQRNGELSNITQDLRKQQEELLQQLHAVQNQLTNAAQENTQLSEKAEQLTADNAEWSQKAEQLTADNAEWSQKVEQLTADNAGLSQKLKNLTKYNAELSAKIAQHDDLFLHKSIEADKWQSQYATAQNTINQLHEQLRDVITQEYYNNALNDLRSELTATHNKAILKTMHDNEEQIKHLKTLHQRDIDHITLTHTVVMQQLAHTHQQTIDSVQQKITEENNQLKVDIEVMRRERDIALQTPPTQVADTMAQERKKLAETLQKTEKLSADIQQMLNKFNISSAKHVVHEV